MSYRVALGIPTRGWFCPETVFSLWCMQDYAREQAKTGIPVEFTGFSMPMHRFLIAARHNIVLEAQKAKATHILWIDDDIQFPPDTLNRLAAWDKDFVATNYVTKSFPARPNATLPDETQRWGRYLYTNPGDTGLIQAFGAGFGCALTKVEIFDKVELPWFAHPWTTDARHGHIPVGEDYYFCEKAREAGIDIWIDQGLSLEIGHVGTLPFRHHMTE